MEAILEHKFSLFCLKFKASWSLLGSHSTLVFLIPFFPIKGDPGSGPGWEDPLEKGMAVLANILAWRIPWTEEPGGLQSMGLQRFGHDWAANTFTFPNKTQKTWLSTVCLCRLFISVWNCVHIFSLSFYLEQKELFRNQQVSGERFPWVTLEITLGLFLILTLKIPLICLVGQGREERQRDVSPL